MRHIELKTAWTFEKRSFLIIFILLAAASTVQIALNEGTHVYGIYNTGALTLLGGGNPYPTDWHTNIGFTNWFLYPPFFSVFFYPFSTAALGAKAGAIGWMWLNIMVFYSGLMALMGTLGGAMVFRRWRIILAFFLIGNNLLSAVLLVQINLLVTGLMLWGAVLYSQRRYAWAGIVLAIASALKIYPLVLVLILSLGMELSFMGSAFGFLLFFTLMPVLFIGWDAMLKLLGHLVAFFFSDPLHPNYLGLQPTMYAFGWNVPDWLFTLFMLACAAAIALICLPSAKDSRRLAGTAVPFALSFIILFNKRTEWASFIVLAPILIYMFHAYLVAKDAGESEEAKTLLRYVIVTWVLISYISSDLCPRPLRLILSEYHLKGLSAVVGLMWSWRAAYRPRTLDGDTVEGTNEPC